MRPILIIFALTAAHIAAAQDHIHPAGSTDKLGKVSFTVSCSAATQPKFERAVAMLHSFWFDAADAAFTDIMSADSACAMVYWGRAVTMMANPMARAAPSPQAMQQGARFAERAKELVGTASHREQMYVDAVLSYYRDADTQSHLARMKTFEQSLDALRRAHPEDMEAAIFYARTLVANASPADRTFANQLAAAALMQPLFEKHPHHPGLAHYLIHAYDAPPIASRGSKAASVYAGIAPDAPHALHMPTHIFTRLGQWDESIELNNRSARAEPDSNAAVHPMDYMVYAFLQQGRERDAKRVLDRAVQNSDRFYGGLLGYNFTAMPARYALERGAWTEAAALKLPVGGLPYVHAITHFARAIGAARSGNVPQARADLDSLTALKSRLEAAKDAYWSTIVESQHLAASAWVAWTSRDTAEALRLASAGADLEETVEKNPVTPGPILPGRELEGDLFMELNRPADALVAYEKTLTREPRRLRAIYGAARAAERAGNSAAARKRYAELLELMSKADPGRSEPIAARKYLAAR